jgi:hypothetical protein
MKAAMKGNIRLRMKNQRRIVPKGSKQLIKFSSDNDLFNSKHFVLYIIVLFRGKKKRSSMH